MRIAKTLTALTLFLALPALALASGNSDARVRIIHASPDTGAVDVLVNDTIPAVTGADFTAITDYIPLPAESYNFKVVPTGGMPDSAAINIDQNLFFGTDYTVLAVNFFDQIEPLLLVDDDRYVRGHNAKVRLVHASPNAGPVDIKITNGPFLAQGVDFKGFTGYLRIPGGTYDVEIRPAGDPEPVAVVEGVHVPNGVAATLYAVGVVGGDPEVDGFRVLSSIDYKNYSARSRR